MRNGRKSGTLSLRLSPLIVILVRGLAARAPHQSSTGSAIVLFFMMISWLVIGLLHNFVDGNEVVCRL